MKIHPYYFSWQKRIFDLMLAFSLLIVLSPLLTIIACLVWLTAGWPIIYTQKRMGQDKKAFTIYKFRTMYKNAHQQQKKYQQLNQAPSPMFKIYNDPRFIGIGQFLSKSGLDELPQLINIIKGEMSFIGPRPLPVHEAKALSKSWDFRYQVKPGILSEWAIDKNRNRSLRKWKELEREGLTKGKLNEDIKIMIKMVKNSFKNLFQK